MELAEESASEAYEMHTALLSKGFALERPPSVHQVNGHSLMTSYKFDPTSTPFHCPSLHKNTEGSE